MNIFERARQNAAKIAAEQQEAGIAPKEAGNNNPSPLEQLEAERTLLEQQIEIGGQSTPEDREKLAEIDNRIALLKEAA